MMASFIRQHTAWIAAFGVMLVLPWIFQTGFAITMLNQTGVLIVFALAYNMLLGQGGMLSFGHAVYFGIAGYFTAHYLNGMGEDWLPYIPVTLLPILGGLTGLLFGILIGFVSTRRAGTIFAMTSLGFDHYIEPLRLYLRLYKDCAKHESEETRAALAKAGRRK